MPGDGAVRKRLDERIVLRIECRAKVSALGLDGGAVEIASTSPIAVGISARLETCCTMLLFARHGCLVVGIAFDIGARHPRPGATETAHTRTDVEEERLPLLFAIVADVDIRLARLAHNVGPARRALASASCASTGPPCPARYRAAQAPRVAADCLRRGQDAAVAGACMAFPRSIRWSGTTVADPTLSMRGA